MRGMLLGMITLMAMLGAFVSLTRHEPITGGFFVFALIVAFTIGGRA